MLGAVASKSSFYVPGQIIQVFLEILPSTTTADMERTWLSFPMV